MVVKAASRVLREAGALARAVEELRVAQRRTLRIAASLTVAEHLLPGWLGPLHEARPGVDVELRVENSDRVAELIGSGQADLGFVESARAPAGLEAEIVAPDELLVVCAPSHRWATRSRPVSARELGRTRLVVREQGAGGRQVLEERLAELGIRAVAPAAEIASPAALRKAVAAGVAPGVVSEWAVRRDIEAGRRDRRPRPAPRPPGGVAPGIAASRPRPHAGQGLIVGGGVRPAGERGGQNADRG